MPAKTISLFYFFFRETREISENEIELIFDKLFLRFIFFVFAETCLEFEYKCFALIYGEWCCVDIGNRYHQ